MSPSDVFNSLLRSPEPILALAPMQDITNHEFCELISQYGAPDIFVTEYFRVYATSRLNKNILRSITDNSTGRPVVAQMIGNDIPMLVRTARELQEHPVAAIDLNLGCPAPIVYRKCAGGGLLKEPHRIDSILGALREAITIPFTVKTRIGFDSMDQWESLLAVFSRHALDLLTVHGRTVREMYRSAVHHDAIALAAERLSCPVLANGNVYSAAKAESVLQETGTRGLMVGRAAIRNPWIFRQIREHLQNRPVFQPAGRDVLDYIRALHASICSPEASERSRIHRLKKFMNFIGLGIDAEGAFLHQIRRVNQEADFFRTCEEFLDHSHPMPLEPFHLELHDRDSLTGEHR